MATGNRVLLFLGAFAATVVAGGQMLRADTAAATIESNGYQGTGYNQNLGWSFTPSTNITVTSLGWFDSSSTIFGNLGGWQPGLGSAHTIGIFSSSGQLLVSGTVDPGTGNAAAGSPVTNMAGIESGVFRYVGITPTSLLAGQTYTIAGNNPPGTTDAFAVVNKTPNAGSLFNTDPAITFVRGWMSNFGTGASLLLPTLTPGPGTTGAYFGPNFQFTIGATTVTDPVPIQNPEPASIAAWAVIACAAGLAARRRAPWTGLR